MGKYMKKGKISFSGDVVAVMEIQQQQQQQSSSASLGVRTRARTLALQPNPELSYLQLRSRRLEKPPFPTPPPKTSTKTSNNSKQQQQGKSGGGVVRGENGGDELGEGRFGNFTDWCELNNNEAEEGSFGGENNLEFDSSSRERSTRESTPCSLIRGSDTIGTPGSTTRPTCSAAANRRVRNMQRAIPTTSEMDEFFAGFELNQQELFIERYNYDIVNDVPLPGRFDWVRVDN